MNMCIYVSNLSFCALTLGGGVFLVEFGGIVGNRHFSMRDDELYLLGFYEREVSRHFFYNVVLTFLI